MRNETLRPCTIKPFYRLFNPDDTIATEQSFLLYWPADLGKVVVGECDYNSTVCFFVLFCFVFCLFVCLIFKKIFLFLHRKPHSLNSCRPQIQAVKQTPQTVDVASTYVYKQYI